ncbi:MAG: HEAT repeat domain-containing protein, partial [Candidatus Neomarinimicrobiota bacterium]
DNRTGQQFDIQELIQSGSLENVVIDINENAEAPIKFVTHGEQNIDFSGGLKDTKVRQMLYFLLLNDENPGNRLKAVNLMRNVSPDPESQMVLISSLLSDPNSGVRLQSVKLLGRYRPNERLINACQKVLLEDENEAVRMEALYILAKEPTESLIPLLQVVSSMDENEYIRDESRKLLTDLRSPISIENIEATQ